MPPVGERKDRERPRDYHCPAPPLCREVVLDHVHVRRQLRLDVPERVAREEVATHIGIPRGITVVILERGLKVGGGDAIQFVDRHVIRLRVLVSALLHSKEIHNRWRGGQGWLQDHYSGLLCNGSVPCNCPPPSARTVASHGGLSQLTGLAATRRAGSRPAPHWWRRRSRSVWLWWNAGWRATKHLLPRVEHSCRFIQTAPAEQSPWNGEPCTLEQRPGSGVHWRSCCRSVRILQPNLRAHQRFHAHHLYSFERL